VALSAGADNGDGGFQHRLHTKRRQLITQLAQLQK
jgi:hypothetical protein